MLKKQRTRVLPGELRLYELTEAHGRPDRGRLSRVNRLDHLISDGETRGWFRCRTAFAHISLLSEYNASLSPRNVTRRMTTGVETGIWRIRTIENEW